MEQTEEYVNGQLKNMYGDAFIRGNNGTSKDDLNFLMLLFNCLFLLINFTPIKKKKKKKNSTIFFCPISMIGLSPFMQFST